MNKSVLKNKGFTIVELLIVIVVIGILAAISITAYNGIQTRALNTERMNHARAWQGVFMSYKAIHGQYPVQPNGGYCLGTGFIDGRCRDYMSSDTYYTEADSQSLMNTLASVANSSGGTRHAVNETVGPYAVYYSDIDIDIKVVLKGRASDCPSGTVYNWDDGNGRLICAIKLINK